MSQLKHLVLESPSRITDLKPLGRMTQLSELSAIGSVVGKPWKVKSLDPLGELTSLEYLSIGKLQPERTSLRPLAKLTRLRFLGMDNHFPMEEYARLSKRLPKTECMRFAPYDSGAGKAWKVECRTCGRFDNVVLVTGKRGRWLCQVCDSDKVAAVEAAFEGAGNAL